MAAESPLPVELEVTADTWQGLHAAGYRHFLNVVPEKLSESEFLEVVDLAKRAGGEGGFSFGAFFDDDLQRPLEDHCDLGLYVKRPDGWTPFDGS